MRVSLVVMALGTAALAGTAAVAQGDVIADWRGGPKRMGEPMQATKALVDNRGDVGALAAIVDDMIAWYRTMPRRFPRGSDRGETRALPAIWSEKANF